MKLLVRHTLLCCTLLAGAASVSANPEIPEGSIRVNEQSGNYLKVNLLSQTWVRHTELNPGSTINGHTKSGYTDIGIRRARMQAYGQVADRVFIYSQIGMNNFNFLSERKAGFFIHDIMGEYEVFRKKLSLGTGLSAWNGLTRFAAPAAATILGVDAPLFEQTTNDVTDQFLRKLSVHAKGKFGALDYRVVMSHPMAVHKSNGYNPALSPHSSFSPLPPEMQWQGYVKWDFLDREDNRVPYAPGTYYGKKDVFNIGLGFQYQPRAMWHQSAAGDTLFSPMQHMAIDVFYDKPVMRRKGKNTSIHAYAAFIQFNHGPGYLRTQSVMNPANGTLSADPFSSAGNGYPSFGTGSLLYSQLGFRFAESLIGKTALMPYVSAQWADYDRLNDHLLFWDTGINWLLNGHSSRLTFACQTRPVFKMGDNGKGSLNGNKRAYIMQYQVAL